MTMRTSSIVLLIALPVLFFGSCRKGENNVAKPDRDHTAALDNYRAEFYFADALKQSDIAFKNGVGGCIQSVTIDLDAMPHTMLIDFGTTNCVGQDGLTRRGQLLVTFTGPYTEPGTQITITPQNFFVNDHAIQGVKTVTNAGPNDQGQTHFNVAVTGTITAPDGSWTSTHNYQRTRTWIQGEGTPALLDDVYLITGGGNGINRNGVPFTVNITTPLRVEVGCPWIVSGVQEIIPGGLPARIINYGDGACDPQVTITVGGFSFVIGG
jgi:hypothetical protein